MQSVNTGGKPPSLTYRSCLSLRANLRICWLALSFERAVAMIRQFANVLMAFQTAQYTVHCVCVFSNKPGTAGPLPDEGLYLKLRLGFGAGPG